MTKIERRTLPLRIFSPDHMIPMRGKLGQALVRWADGHPGLVKSPEGRRFKYADKKGRDRIFVVQNQRAGRRVACWYYIPDEVKP